MAVPVIAPGVAGVPGLTVTASVLTALVPHEFPAVTVTFPFWPALPVVTVMDVVPVPAVIFQPAGTAHVYVVALGTAAMLYVWPVKPGHCVAVPVMTPGVAGVPGFTVTASVLAALVPHEFPAVTVMFPFCPVLPVVTVIDVVPVPAVILQPAGTAHVYVVALGTAAML